MLSAVSEVSEAVRLPFPERRWRNFDMSAVAYHHAHLINRRILQIAGQSALH